LTAVQCGDGAARNRPKQRKLKLVDMEVQDVEVAGALTYSIEHQHVIGSRIDHARVQPQCLRYTGHKISRRNRIAACKQGDIMAERHQLLGQVGNDTFSAAIKPRRHAFKERRNLRNLHFVSQLPRESNLRIDQLFRGSSCAISRDGRMMRFN